MTGIRIFTVALTVIMLAAITVSIASGSIAQEGKLLLDTAWGRMSLIDIYVGAALIAGWVYLREANPWVLVIWVPVFIVLGHGGTALYASIAAFRSDDVKSFLLGARTGINQSRP